jgi:hypothetical protein
MNKSATVIGGSNNLVSRHEVLALASKLFKHFLFLGNKESEIEARRQILC